MFIGIDLGTSGVKAVLLDRGGALRASALAPLSVSQPHPRWSEQDPEQWWQATLTAMDQLLQQVVQLDMSPAAIEAIGLSGQMHGATLLDARGQVLRPAILWNDGRSAAECAELESLTNFRVITGNLAMPGFTAPKLLWLRQHEPEVFARIDKVLLPKDYLRYRLSGDFATDPSDAAGTLWLDVARREWSPAMLTACGLSKEQMPTVIEGPRVTGHLRGELARRWSMGEVAIAAGAGDNAAGAIGMGVVRPGQAMLSLGTSGVFFAVSDGFHARPQQAVHSFCHALPDTWHLMSVMLNAASCLDVAARWGGYAAIRSMLEAAQLAPMDVQRPWFLPYLNGERTPHNDVDAAGTFYGLTSATRREDMAHAVLEGVGLGLLDGIEAVRAAGVDTGPISVIGGGTRSIYWLQMLADIIGKPLQLHDGGEVGPALGAARLARMAVDGDADVATACPRPPLVQLLEPCNGRHEYYLEQRQPVFRELYLRLKGMRRDGSSAGEESCAG
ncbi:xylulokinase [Rhodanobacter ginsengiterrae]|uniref:xylulokinase n=1 Tax=Rhodanobacter ginsengiterrae TaxID=2008451 RepID=UPI003CF53A92